MPVRSLIGPLIVALAMWAAAGELTLPGDEASRRLVVPASPIWLLAGLALGLIVPAWRRTPTLAAPALLAVLPWLPLPIPATLLIWTGPLAWAPIGLALIAAGVARIRPTLPEARPTPAAAHAVAAGLATLIAGAFVLHSVGGRLPGGDEPHYLIIAQSLLQDGDLRIANNHENRDYAAYWGGDLAPHVVQTGRGGEIYSIHAPGVAVLVAPMFALFGVAGAQWTILALAALGGAFIWLGGWYATYQRSAAWFAWAAVAGAVTMLVQSVMIFPDGPGAFVVAVAGVVWLRLARGDRVSTAQLVGLSGFLAALPFLHTRFVVLAAGLGLAIAYRLWRSDDAGRRVRRLVVFFTLPAIGAVCWFGYFFLLYGTPNPTIPYGPNSESRLAYAPGGVIGLLFDQQFGLLAYSPILAFAAAGWFRRRSDGDLAVSPLWCVIGLYLAAVAMYWMWWAGVPATPARLATSVLPLLAAPLAIAWRNAGPAARTVATALLAASLGLSLLVLGTDEGALAWSTRDAQAAWLWVAGPVVDLPRAWPSFFWRLIGGDVSSEWPFVLHVGAWVGTFSVVAWLVRVVADTADRDRIVSLASVALPVALMVAAQAGWWLNDVPAARPAPSQVALLRAFVNERPVYALSPASILRLEAPPTSMRIPVPRTDLPVGDGAIWAGLRDVPAGNYEVRLASRRPAGGTLAVRVGFSREPIHVAVLPRQSMHTFTFGLPVGTTDLRFIPDAGLASGAGSLSLRPVALAVGPYAPVQARLDFDGGHAFVLGGAPFVEGRALWVRGGGSTELALSGTTGTTGVARVVAITLVNGPTPNAVQVLVDGEIRQFDLGSATSVDVPVTIAEGRTVRVVVKSPAGFRPSDAGSSRDDRYLGVRVEFGGASTDAPPDHQ